MSPESRALRVWFGAALAGGLLLLLCAVSLAVWLTARSYRRAPIAAAEVAHNAPAIMTDAEPARVAPPLTNTATDVVPAAAVAPVADASATRHRANPATAKTSEVARQSVRAAKRTAPMMKAAGGAHRTDVAAIKQIVFTGRATGATLAPIITAATTTRATRNRRDLDWWSTDRPSATSEFRGAASVGGHPDSYYYRGLSLAEGRDPRALDRSTLLAALEYFQRARPSVYAKQARRYEDRLGKEYDRRRNAGR